MEKRSEEGTKIKNTADDLRLTQSLDKGEEKRVNEAKDILLGVKENEPYRRFLGRVLRECGPQGVLLCAASFNATTAMSKKARENLLPYLKAYRNDPVLQALARKHGIPDSVETIVRQQFRVQNAEVLTQREYRGAVKVADLQSFLANTYPDTSTQLPIVFPVQDEPFIALGYEASLALITHAQARAQVKLIQQAPVE